MVGVNESRLRGVPIFSMLDDESLALVAGSALEFEAPRGHVLMEIGRPGTGLFILEEGELTVEFPGGRRVTLGPGEFVGELALLTDAAHTGRVSARTDVRCLAIDRDGFDSLLERQPRVAVAMLPVLAQRLVDER